MYTLPTRFTTTALVFLALSCLIRPATAIWPFPSKRFSGNSLIGAGSRGLDIDGRVVAFGDFNGDQFLDILSLGSDQETLSVYLWNHDSFLYTKATSFKHPRHVFNVVPGDFTHDGKLDLLVMSQSRSSAQLDMTLYRGSSEGGFAMSSLVVPASTLAQPIPLDTDGDMKIDLLGITPASKGNANSPLMIWQNVWNASEANSPIFKLETPKFVGTPCSPSNPHSNAVVDLNGDCLADVFLTCDDGRGGKSFQIWVNNKDAGFSLGQQSLLPAGVQSISFADMDRDGTIDLVFPTCSSVSSWTGLGIDCVINVAYNKQLPLCTSSATRGVNGSRSCRPPEQLCTVDPNFNFDMNALVKIPLASLFPSAAGASSPSLLVLDTSHTPALPVPLKLGDANLDGFPDILAIVAPGSQLSDRTPRLAFSVPCGKGIAGCGKDGNGRRGWKVVVDGTEPLDGVKDARGVAFLDMDEDGTLDIMVQRTGKAGQGNILFVQNNFYYDAFFLKAIVLNGACNNGWCETPNATQRYQPFGVSYSGATFKYTVLDTSGRRSAAQVGQLPQTSYHSLLTPYSFFGLGRTNNYIENLFVGSTKHAEKHFINMEGVIPNSKLVILPSENETPWKRELFLRPGAWIPWVTLTVLVGTAVLAIIVLILHLNEKREDELERRRAAHHINFAAL